MPMKHKDCEERNEPATLTERGLAAIQSPGKPNGLSHGIFECLIVEASSQAQNHLSVLADGHTERCRGVFDCTCDPEVFKAVMQHPAPGDIHDVSHRAPASVQHGGPAAIDVDGHWQGQLLELVPENQAPRPSVVCRDCSG